MTGDGTEVGIELWGAGVKWVLGGAEDIQIPIVKEVRVSSATSRLDHAPSWLRRKPGITHRI